MLRLPLPSGLQLMFFYPRLGMVFLHKQLYLIYGPLERSLLLDLA